MSQENVEVMRRVVALFNARDFDAMSEVADRSWEWHTSAEMPEPAVHRGLDAVKAFGNEFFEQWDEYRLDVERFIEVGNRVVVLCRMRGRGKGSGVPVDRFMAYLNTLQNGKLVRTEVFLDRQAALEAVGLSEQDAHANS